MKQLFQSCGHYWVFQVCWYTECSTFTASSFRIWNSSTGIPSPPLSLFLVMLSKAHLTSHSRMSGSRWVIIPSWLSGSWRSFLYSSSVYSCHLFLISYAFVRSIPFLSFIVPIFAWNVPLVFLIFLKGSLVFLFLLFSSLFLCTDHWGRLSYLSLLFSGTCTQIGISFLFSFSFCFSSLHSKTVRGVKSCLESNPIPSRDSGSSNKPCAHQDPETPQRLRQNCVFWVSPAVGRVSSGLLQGLWVQQTWVWHKVGLICH